MNSDAMLDATERDVARAFPFVLVLFCASGGAALIYEIVWYQLLQIAIGSTAISLGVLLASFMGGLCLGSLACPGDLLRCSAIR
jgi:spermidine synthase